MPLTKSTPLYQGNEKQEFQKTVDKLSQSLLEQNTELKQQKNIIYLGFIVIIFMVVGIVFSYIEFVYSGSRNDDYKYNLSEKVFNQETNIKILKNCLNISKWLNPKCFED